MSTIVKYCCNSMAETINISSTVQNIGWCCFEGAKHLVTVSLPNSLLSIGFRSFADCIKLEKIIIPDSVNYIGNQAFENCIGLQCGSVKFPPVLKNDLINAGIQNEALDKCITPIFSIKSDRICAVQIALLNTLILGK